MNDISYIYKESNQEKENTDITDKIWITKELMNYRKRKN